MMDTPTSLERLAVLETEVEAMRSEVKELRAEIRALVDAWNAATGLVKFIKLLSTAHPEGAQGQGQPDRIHRIHHAGRRGSRGRDKAATARSISTRRSPPRSRKSRRATCCG
jgi:hypothetical protein